MGKKIGPNPTDRAKLGTKRSALSDGAGVPLSVVVDGANRNDFKLLAGTLFACEIPIPEPDDDIEVGICLDKGYDYDEVRDLVADFGFTAHIRSRGEEAKKLKDEAGFRARRWVVERLHSWLNRFRRLLVRWEKLGETYLGMLHLACGIITWRAIRRHQQAALSK